MWVSLESNYFVQGFHARLAMYQVLPTPHSVITEPALCILFFGLYCGGGGCYYRLQCSSNLLKFLGHVWKPFFRWKNDVLSSKTWKSCLDWVNGCTFTNLIYLFFWSRKVESPPPFWSKEFFCSIKYNIMKFFTEPMNNKIHSWERISLAEEKLPTCT